MVAFQTLVNPDDDDDMREADLQQEKLEICLLTKDTFPAFYQVCFFCLWCCLCCRGCFCRRLIPR